MKYISKQAFTLLLVAVVMLAAIFPELGKSGGTLHSEVTTKLGVWLIFFLQGLGLPIRELTSGYKPKRLHVFVLSWNYLLFPLAAAVIVLIYGRFLPEPLRAGIWLLAILPTTVSSAVIFSSVSGGHVSNAIFSTVVSNVLAVIIVPSIAVAYWATAGSAEIALSPLFSKLGMLILFPLILGQLLRWWQPKLSNAVAKRSKKLSHGIILFIVLAAFSDSVESGFLDTLSGSALAVVVSATVSLLLLVSLAVWFSAGAVGLNKPQQITAFFCGSQKSLATGLPLLSSLLAASPAVIDPAAALIPLMCYHPAQLVLASWFSQRLIAKQAVPDS
jgi:sodium/bile acid cotransporter 7